MERMSVKSGILDLLWRILQHLLPSKPYLRLKYRVVFKRSLNLDNPRTFNEKLQWLKLFGCKPEYAVMVDKVLVKDYLRGKIGAEHVVPTIAVWDAADKMDVECLPDRFVLKCNHDSGQVVVCRDKSTFNVDEAKKLLRKSLHHNYYLMGRETPYRFVKRKVMAEAYLDSENGELKDYKVHNFNGEPKFILVCKDRFSETGLTEDFYSPEWKHLDMRRPDHPISKEAEECPAELDEMLRISRILSAGIPFLRTDFYIVNHKVYVGELTFYPSSGFARFVPDEWDYLIGDWLILPEKRTDLC